jgi:cytochrome c556
MHHALKSFVAVFALLTVGQVESHTGDDDQIAAVNRHSLMMIMGWGIKPIADMTSGKRTFDSEIAALQATRLTHLADMIPDVFARNTSGKKLKTLTLDKVWETPDDFREKAAQTAKAAADYGQALSEGEAQAKRAFKGLADSCKACHEEYKSE